MTNNIDYILTSHYGAPYIYPVVYVYIPGGMCISPVVYVYPWWYVYVHPWWYMYIPGGICTYIPGGICISLHGGMCISLHGGMCIDPLQMMSRAAHMISSAMLVNKLRATPSEYNYNMSKFINYTALKVATGEKEPRPGA